MREIRIQKLDDNGRYDFGAGYICGYSDFGGLPIYFFERNNLGKVLYTVFDGFNPQYDCEFVVFKGTGRELLYWIEKGTEGTECDENGNHSDDYREFYNVYKSNSFELVFIVEPCDNNEISSADDAYVLDPKTKKKLYHIEIRNLVFARRNYIVRFKKDKFVQSEKVNAKSFTEAKELIIKKYGNKIIIVGIEKEHPGLF